MKKLFLLLFTSYFLLSPVFSQGVWTPRTPTPTLDSLRFQGVSFSIGNYGYSGLGSGYAGSYDDIWQFDPSNNSWAFKTLFPGLARVSPATFVIGNKVYFVTGSVTSGGTCVKECWEYNAITNIWSQKSNFPGAIRTYAVGFAIGGKGYVGTGAKEDIDWYKDFYAYYTATDTWTRIADFPGIGRNCACGFAVNGKGYVCFGQDSLRPNFSNKDMWEYDTASDSWTQKTSYPGLPTYVASGFVIGNYIYVGSGQDTAVSDSRFWQYNTILDSWTRQADMPRPTGFQGTAFSIGDTGYYGMGDDSLSEVPHNFSRFVPDAATNITGLNAKENEISIFPSPLISSCTVTLPKEAQNIPVFSLADMAGKEMEITVVKNSPHTFILDRESLRAGVYILSLKYDNQVIYKKLVITD